MSIFSNSSLDPLVFKSAWLPEFVMLPRFPTPAQPSLESIPATSEVRKIYPRDFFPNPNTVRFPMGNTTYWLFGPVNGPKVVLVHGISTPAIIWKDMAPFLAENGFRVLVYDLYGRGYSEAPETAYNVGLYTTQLALLFQHVQFSSAHIVGLSMGGGIAAAFAATFPNLVTEKIAFVASAGLMKLPTARQDIKEALAAAGFAETQHRTLPGKMKALQTQCLPGFAHALTSSMKEGPITGLENAFKAISETPRLKCLIIHGTNDTIALFRDGEKIKQLIPAAEFVPIEGAEHDCVIAEAYYDPVRKEVLKFLEGPTL